MNTLPSDIDPNFVPSLYAVAAQLNSDPVNLAMSLYMESEIKAHARNSIGCLGINQMCPGNFAGLGIDPATYTQLPASQQLCHYVFPFWRSIMGRHGLSSLSARDVEWLNFLPATFVPNAPDDHVVTSNPTYVNANKGFDHGNKGYITAGDIGQSVANACTGARWLAIHAAIVAGNPNAGLIGGGIAGILLAFGTAVFFLAKAVRA